MLDDALVHIFTDIAVHMDANVSILVVLDDALVLGKRVSSVVAKASQSLLCWTML